MNENESFDRSKIRGLSSEEIQQNNVEASEYMPRSNSKRVDYLTIIAGSNTRRVYPAHPGSKKFFAPKCVSWLSIEKEVYKKAAGGGDDVKEKAIMRLPVFNSRVHSNIGEDLVEAYIAYAKKVLAEEITDKKILDKKLWPILDWRSGINPQLGWIFYANAYKADGTKQFGKQEITDGVKKQLDNLCMTEEAGKPIMVDRFSDPDTGKAFSIISDPNAADKKKKYSVALLWDKDWKLSDDELKNWMEVPSLESLFIDSFKRSDFLKQVEGLQRFDSTTHTINLGDGKKISFEYNFFSHSEFQAIVERIGSHFPKDETTSTEGENESENNYSDQEPSGENPLDSLSKEELLKFIDDHKIDLSPRPSHSVERIAADILDVALENHNNDRAKAISTINELLTINTNVVKSTETTEATKAEEAPKENALGNIKAKYS